MKVLVSDSSILIEFSKRELLDRMFQLEFQFAVPDLLFHEELIGPGWVQPAGPARLWTEGGITGCRRSGNRHRLSVRATSPELGGFICSRNSRPSRMAPTDGGQDHAQRRSIQRDRTSGCALGRRQHAGCRNSIDAPGRGGA